jgi:hypothetical protein
VRKTVNPDDAWKIEWQREIPPELPPSEIVTYLTALPQTAVDEAGNYWCLGRTLGSEDQYLVKVADGPWRVVDALVFREANEPGTYLDYLGPPSVSGGLIWIAWQGDDSSKCRVVYVRAFDPETGARVRDFEIPAKFTGRRGGDGAGEGRSAFAAVADDGYLYVTTFSEEMNWQDGDSMYDCRWWAKHDRMLKLNAETGAVLDIVERDRPTLIGTAYGYSMWNGMVLHPFNLWEGREVEYRGRWDMSDRISLGAAPCWNLDHPTDDAYFYGFDHGPTTFWLTNGGPRPAWGSDTPVMQLRTSGVALWMGRRLTNRCGTVPPGGSVQVEVVLDAAKAEMGLNESALIVESTDPNMPSVEIPVRLTVDGAVEIVTASTGARYEVAEAAVGTACYTDRQYRILELDGSLAGGLLVRTADKDKYVTVPEHLTLNLAEPATVSVCVDTRITALPGWLNGWSYAGTGVVVETGDGAACPMKVYRKNVSAGTLTLGGNGVGAASGDRSNYLVIVNPN